MSPSSSSEPEGARIPPRCALPLPPAPSPAEALSRIPLPWSDCPDWPDLPDRPDCPDWPCCPIEPPVTELPLSPPDDPSAAPREPLNPLPDCWSPCRGVLEGFPPVPPWFDVPDLSLSSMSMSSSAWWIPSSRTVGLQTSARRWGRWGH